MYRYILYVELYSHININLKRIILISYLNIISIMELTVYSYKIKI